MAIEPGPPHPSDATTGLRLERVVKEYRVGGQPLRALDGITLAVPRRQFIAVMGRSGSGKTTLVNLAAGIDTPSAGEVWIDGTPISGLDDDALTLLRRDRVGIVYQFFNLLSTLTVRENVALPALLAGVREQDALPRADRLIDEVGLTPRRSIRPHALSGGEMQRVAIARALVRDPALVLADEPTGNLDSRAASQVVSLLRTLASCHGATVVLVTHSAEAAAAADRVVELRDGRIVRDSGAGA